MVVHEWTASRPSLLIAADLQRPHARKDIELRLRADRASHSRLPVSSLLDALADHTAYRIVMRRGFPALLALTVIACSPSGPGAALAPMPRTALQAPPLSAPLRASGEVLVAFVNERGLSAGPWVGAEALGSLRAAILPCHTNALHSHPEEMGYVLVHGVVVGGRVFEPRVIESRGFSPITVDCVRQALEAARFDWPYDRSEGLLYIKML
jgi:hypothetical protein